MRKPDLIFITGCNAAGKSSLIRTHLSLFPEFEVIMTDVYKARSKGVFKEAVEREKNIILETPFNNEGFKDLIDLARNAGYRSTLIVLFLKSHIHSLERVAARRNFENGLFISAEEVEFNFIENFKNVAKFFPYFDETFFVYTGVKDQNQLIMKFQQDVLIEYKSNEFVFIQKFAEYALKSDRLNKRDFEIIQANRDFESEFHEIVPRKRFRWEQSK
jgi:predicted ABC-type ATPase